MHAAVLVQTALRVLSAWSCGQTPKTEDVTVLRAHALPQETGLADDELACVIVQRECQRVMTTAQADRKTLQRVTRRKPRVA